MGESLEPRQVNQQVRGSVAPSEAPERHSDTEEVTGSNPVRPTPFFEIVSSGSSSNGSQPPGDLSYSLQVRDDVPDTVLARLSPANVGQTRIQRTHDIMYPARSRLGGEPGQEPERPGSR